jgi:RNA polymerase sigma-70 factor (ECF subfamily)
MFDRILRHHSSLSREKERGSAVDGEIERRLIREALEGDRAARERLLKGHSRRVFAVCLGMLENFHDAEDCAQEALIRGLTQLHQLHSDEQFGGWITRIARNVCIDFMRKRKRTAEAMTALDPPSENAEDRYVDLYDAIGRLAEDYRVPLLLYYFDGRSSESVARSLGMSAAGVLTRLSRARRELRDLLGRKGVRNGQAM